MIYIKNVVYDFDLKYSLFIGKEDIKSAMLYDCVKNELIAKLEGHTDAIIYAEFNNTSEYVSTTSKDNTVIVWKTKNGKLHKKLMGHSDHINHVTFGYKNPYIATSSLDNTIKIWNYLNGKLIKTLNHEKVFLVSFSKNDKLLSVDYDNKIIVYDKNWRVINEMVITDTNKDRELDRVVFTEDELYVNVYYTDYTSKKLKIY